MTNFTFPYNSYIYDNWAESYIRPAPSVTATATASSPPLQQSPVFTSSPPIEATVTKDHHGA